MNNISAYITFIIITLFTSTSTAKTYVLLTVDVESFSNGNPLRDIYGKFPGNDKEYGVPLILDILNRNNVKATFYLNVYEIPKHGEEDLKNIAQLISEKNQDLELHTHPKPMFGKYGMSLFSKDEQRKIIEKGISLISEWSRSTVVAHRAGAYLGNLNTLDAVKDSGLSVDASLSPASASPLFRQGHHENDITKIHGILELPVTFFTQIKVPGFESKRFLDIESTSMRELKYILNEMADRNMCHANIMMHSFSITRYGYPDMRVVDKLKQLIQFVESHPNLEMIDTKGFLKKYNRGELECQPDPNFVPNTGFFLTYLRAWDRITDGWKNVAVAIGPVIFLIMIVFVISMHRRKQRITK